MIRILEIFPGLLTWLTLIGVFVLAYLHPVWISIYIILFDVYWLLKAGNVAIHLVHSYRNLKAHDRIDWLTWLTKLGGVDEFKLSLSVRVIEEKDKPVKVVVA